jgi:lipooligosaccharide transport system ATP-binding protein
LGVADENKVEALHPITPAGASAGGEVKGAASDAAAGLVQPPPASSQNPDVVTARSLTKIYDKQKAVDGIDFDVRRGETFGLLGPNGAGKSTTMRMIACRATPTAGDLCVDGLNVHTQARQIRSLIGVVPQDNNLDPDLTVIKNLIIYASYYAIPKRKAAIRAAELLDFIGMSGRAHDRIDQLSGGMKRRLMIARALLHEPRLLVLDEPTTGLDPQVRQEIWQKLEELRRVSGVTIILSTHYMEEAEKLCERLVVIDHGKVLAAGTPRELVLAKVSRYALEVRDVAERPLLQTSDGISSVARNSAHFYFAAEAEMLTPLMNEYRGRRRMIRLSNLEDVFLQLVGEHDSTN